MIKAFEQAMKMEDRQAVLRQLLAIRYGELDDSLLPVVEPLAQMESNVMLRLLLTCSRTELLTAVADSTAIVDPSVLPMDLFQVIGPAETYYLKKEAERAALETLAKLRFGEIDRPIACAITVLLQSPIESSLRQLYCSSREELLTEAERM